MPVGKLGVLTGPKTLSKAIEFPNKLTREFLRERLSIIGGRNYSVEKVTGILKFTVPREPKSSLCSTCRLVF